jgi:hypothetical protein
MEKLRCGVILLPDFIGHLQALCAKREDGLLPAIDYVRCVDGPRSGESWWSLTWTSARAVRPYNLFKVGEMQIYLSPQTQKALRHRYIDFRDGAVFVG